MDSTINYDTAPATAIGQTLTGITLNLLVRNVRAEAAFLGAVFGCSLHRLSDDYAIVRHGLCVMQLHSDSSFARHPLYALLPEAGPRGAGLEIRLHGADPDFAAQAIDSFAGAMLLAAPADKAGHGLREAVILCPNGYAFVPSRPL